ncbi:MAG: hypothetical protein O9283_00025 [Sphingomonadaceae bacterium]|jgi:hypothetical protein|nr:hypothetical protein [Sphingomonadaceae bacterium]
MNPDEALRETLQLVARAMAPARHDWWIVASAACRLHGIDSGAVRDVDVLLDEHDLAAVLVPLGLSPAAGTSDGLFRSRCFVSWDGAPLTVEFFAGFELCEAGQWSEVRLQTREWRGLDGLELPVPQRGELADLLRRFGRPKDLARADRLSPSGPFPSR